VASTLNTRNLWTAAAGVGATVFLIVMVIVGALPEQRQLVKFEAKGVMQVAPERITSVAMRAGERGAIFQRIGNGWAREDGTPLDPELGKRLSMAVQFMNTSGPVRELAPSEYEGSKASEFGLEHPTLSIVLFEGQQPVLGAHFGGHNPDGYLQYVRVEGRKELFMLSRFVGAEWDAVVQGALR
jgi:hypothetical protein